jgi:hypothetical protein
LPRGIRAGVARREGRSDVESSVGVKLEDAMKVPLILTLALVATIPQGKTYDLKLEWKPLTGYKSELSETTSMKMTFTAAGQPPMINERRRLPPRKSHRRRRWRERADLEILGDARGRRTVPFGFERKTVRVNPGPTARVLTDGGADRRRICRSQESVHGRGQAGEPATEDRAAKPTRGSGVRPAGHRHRMFDADASQAVDLTKSRSRFAAVEVQRGMGASMPC